MNDFSTSEPHAAPLRQADQLKQIDAAAEAPSIPEAIPEAIAETRPAAVGPSLNTRHFLTPFIAVAAWIVPGLGHLLVGRWGRAALIFLAVAGLALTGFHARGEVFPPYSDDTFGTLGFLADACSGVFFMIAHVIEKGGPDVSRAAGDYGTRFVAAAGLVNLLAVLDACGIALGRRN